jgi:hypothetical protein
MSDVTAVGTDDLDPEFAITGSLIEIWVDDDDDPLITVQSLDDSDSINSDLEESLVEVDHFDVAPFLTFTHFDGVTDYVRTDTVSRVRVSRVTLVDLNAPESFSDDKSED